VSGEVAHSVVVREPVIGHLKAPGAIALTFDDGPDPTWTPKVLALLQKHHVQAVFCEIGREAEAYPAVVRQVVAAGDMLCDHTQNHDEHIASRSEQQIYAEINDAKVAIANATGGAAPLFFRAPGGDWSPEVEQIARSDGMTPLKWTVDPRDWARPGTQAIVQTVLRELRPGGVILLHDGGGDRSQTIAALSQLLDELPRLGYTFTTPSP
jgi:peptidoglycan/xylan/chitin deacetylase (PgdA/CDA1 family)